jgi:hypothetical protein
MLHFWKNLGANIPAKYFILFLGLILIENNISDQFFPRSFMAFLIPVASVEIASLLHVKSLQKWCFGCKRPLLTTVKVIWEHSQNLFVYLLTTYILTLARIYLVYHSSNKVLVLYWSLQHLPSKIAYWDLIIPPNHENVLFDPHICKCTKQISIFMVYMRTN